MLNHHLIQLYLANIYQIGLNHQKKHFTIIKLSPYLDLSIYYSHKGTN